MEKRAWSVIRLLPVFLAVAFVPLISTVKQYTTDLNRYNWFDSGNSLIDVFLYWKGQALILLAFVMLLFLMATPVLSREQRPDWKKLKTPEIAFLGVYLLFAILSSVFSQYGDTALRGGYEQWEGLNVLLAYGVLFTYVYLTADSERAARYVIYAIVAGSFVVGLIGAGQYFGMDLFRSDFGKSIMSLMSETKMEFSFNFPEGWVYATLYNPNYVGSYASLALPVLIAVATVEWKKIPLFWSILSLIGTFLMVITLLGSQSLTGCVGVILSVIFFIGYRSPTIVRSFGWKKTGIALGAVAALVVAVVLVFPDNVKTGFNKLFHPHADSHAMEDMVSTDRGLKIETVDQGSFYVTVTGDADKPFEFTDESGKEMVLPENKDEGYYEFGVDTPPRTRIRFYATSIQRGDEPVPAVRIQSPYNWKDWYVARIGDNYQIYNAFGRFDSLREIERIGFKNSQHFGTKRGYIWSRTFPLLKNSMILGSGPDTFTIVFPNDDYVGKTNMDYNGVTVTKPHNLYLQIWTQTGFLSLAGFLLLAGWYFVRSLKLYWNRPLKSFMDKIGAALMTAVFGYLVTGLANDSTVTVAPVFWAALALGIAVNRMNEKKVVA